MLKHSVEKLIFTLKPKVKVRENLGYINQKCQIIEPITIFKQGNVPMLHDQELFYFR